VETGFRHFDTAYNYENEKEVGEAIRTQMQMGNVSRENIFLTTKVKHDSFPIFNDILHLYSFGIRTTIPAMYDEFARSNSTL